MLMHSVFALPFHAPPRSGLVPPGLKIACRNFGVKRQGSLEPLILPAAAGAPNRGTGLMESNVRS